MPSISRILVPIDFSPGSDAALRWALDVADDCGAEVQLLHVWCPRRATARAIFAETPEGEAMQHRLSEAESDHASRVFGRLEFGEDASRVILSILDEEPFDLVVMGQSGDGHRSDEGHVASSVAERARCSVVRLRA